MTVAVRAVAALVERMLDADGPLPRCARSSACSRALSPRTKTLPGPRLPNEPGQRSAGISTQNLPIDICFGCFGCFIYFIRIS